MKDLQCTVMLAIACLVFAGCEDHRTAVEPGSEATARVLAAGNPFRGVNGIMFGPDGLLYAASVVTPGIGVIDPDTGQVLRTIGPAEGAQGPDDLAFGPEGSLYWTDILQGNVVRRSPDGTVAVIARPGPGVNPVTFSDDGRLFVAQCFLDDRLFELDPSGADAPRLVSDQLGPGCGLNGMDWGPDGMLYGPRWFAGEVVKVDVATGAFATVASGFGVPAAVKFDSAGRLHVLDALPGEVVRVDLASGSRDVVGRVPPSTADNLAFDSDGRLFVSSYGDGWILEVLENEIRVVIPAGAVNMPGGLAWHDGANGPVLYVADFFALRGLDPATGSLEYVANDIIGFSDLGSVSSVAARGAELILTTWLDNAVRVWDPATNSRVADITDLAGPVHAVPLGNDLLISEAGVGRVIRVDPTEPGVRVPVAEGLKAPAGLAVSAGDAFVADRVAGEVVQIAENGEVLAAPRRIADGLAAPEGIAATEQALFVVESGTGQLTRVDRRSGARSSLVTGLDPHEVLFDGVALDPDGNIYVTAERGAAIWVIGPCGDK